MGNSVVRLWIEVFLVRQQGFIERKSNICAGKRQYRMTIDKRKLYGNVTMIGTVLDPMNLARACHLCRMFGKRRSLLELPVLLPHIYLCLERESPMLRIVSTFRHIDAAECNRCLVR